jgi:hypothetical protein
MMTLHFGDRKIGEYFEIDIGGGNWVAGQKTTPDTFVRNDGWAVKVSFWSRTR